MNSIVAFSPDNDLTMSSVEIARLCEKRHDHVLRDIDAILSEGPAPNFGLAFKSRTYKDIQGQERRCFDCTKRGALLLVTGYSVAHRLRLIVRWEELEAQIAAPVLPPQAFTKALTVRDHAVNVATTELALANLLCVPLHLAQVEAVKTTYRETGISFEHLLHLAPAQQNLLPEQVYLEPTELAKALGIGNAAKMNRRLAAAGLQVKAPIGWSPTEAGKVIAHLHQWSAGSKSGINLKWSLEEVREALGVTA